MSGEQEGIVWKKYKGLPMADGRSAGDKSAPDYSRFGARLQREILITAPFTAIPVYEMPDDLLRAPTPLELQLFEPALYLPDAPTAHTRLSSPLGRLHARIFWSVGNTGPMRLDCDWCGSVPLVAHKALSVAVVADRFHAVHGAEGYSDWSSGFNFNDDTLNVGDPGTAQLSFNAALPPGPVTTPPTIAYLSRESLTTEDAADFTGQQTNQRLKLTVTWSTGEVIRFWVSSVEEFAAYLKITLAGLTQATTLVVGLLDGATPNVQLGFDDGPDYTRIDVAVGLLLGGRAPTALPTYTYPATSLAAAATATFPVPAFARKLRCAFKWGDTDGSEPDAALGQYYVAFLSRGFGALAWIDGASAREGLFGEGIAVPPGTHAVMIDNRSPDPLQVLPSFVLGL